MQLLHYAASNCAIVLISRAYKKDLLIMVFYLGVFHILRKHLEGGGGLKNSQNVLLYMGGQKYQKICLRNM